MQIKFTGHQVDVTPSIQQYTNKRFTRLQRHYDRISKIAVTFSVEKLLQIAEATIQLSGGKIHATAKSDDLYTAIDTLVDKLDRQIIKHKEKNTGH